MKPLAKRLLNVFSAILNTIVVAVLIISLVNIVVIVRETIGGPGFNSDAVIIGLSVLILPTLFVATVNYLAFGKFRLWNRLTAN